MAFPQQAGTPDYTRAGTSKFIPELWASKLIQNLYASTVFGEIANTDYDGIISKFGDVVQIRTTPEITIRTYAKGQNLVNERPEKASLTLNIDQGDYFACIEDDVDRIQADIELLDTWSKDASTRMKLKMDRTLLDSVATGGQSANLSALNIGNTAGAISANIALGATGTPVAVTKVNILDYIVNLGVVLDESNTPEDGRWLVMPAWACGMIKKSDLKDASLSGDGSSILRNGRIGMIDRFTIYMSNQITRTTEGANTAFHMFAGHKMGLTFATQMTEMETLRSETTFGNVIRGLQVYGFQITKSDVLTRLYGYQA